MIFYNYTVSLPWELGLRIVYVLEIPVLVYDGGLDKTWTNVQTLSKLCPKFVHGLSNLSQCPNFVHTLSIKLSFVQCLSSLCLRNV